MCVTQMTQITVKKVLLGKNPNGHLSKRIREGAGPEALQCTCEVRWYGYQVEIITSRTLSVRKNLFALNFTQK